MPEEVLWRDEEVAELFVQDKLERKSAHSILRALFAQLQGVFGEGIVQRCRIPAHCHIWRLAAGEARVVDDSGVSRVQKSDGTVSEVLPPDFRLQDVTTIMSVVDRGTVGRAALWFIGTHGRTAMGWKFGVCHDEWNALKNASKKCVVERSSLWTYLVKFSGIANINHGPYRSGRWGKEKQTTHAKLCNGLITKESARFLHAAEKQALLEGRDPATSLELMWQRFGSLPSCVEAGPVLKFARWMSINDTWKFLRGEIWLLKLVLEFLREDLTAQPQQLETTAAWDSVREAGAPEGKKGIIVKAPGLAIWSPRNRPGN